MQQDDDDIEWRNPSNWRGPFYYSKRDRRALVPKRLGIGLTINFAHPAGIAFLVALVVVVAVAIAVSLSSRR